MNLNLIKKNKLDTDAKLITDLSKKLNLHSKLVELLISRGIDSEDKINIFLNPSVDDFYDPFLLKGMDNAVKRINKAIENKEKIIIYGDYDADGICAAAILTLYLIGKGLDIYTHIPNRVGEGYGLSIESLEKIIDAYCPDLIITCDCGISGFNEVEFAMDLGVDMIVTDHHEVSELIPNCIVVNPKQNDCHYPYNFLCGAGVALKVVQALGGKDELMKYLDLACIATIADLVPLLDENRLIVQLGLLHINKRKNLGIKILLDNLNLTAVTSSDIAYKIAPRINAAGRMGDAYRSFELLTCDDSGRIKEILEEINEDNSKRKDVCDTLYNEAIDDLAFEDMVHNRAIVLSHPSWEKGITGIVAARLTNDFKRPAIILVNSGESYKGTSRSVEGINIYELLASVSDILLEFGGHSQAAGFSIKYENIELFKERINNFLKAYSDDYFMPNIEYDLDIDVKDININLLKALERIEPTGNSNSKPLFRLKLNNMEVTPCKNNTNHTSISTDSGLQILAFNFFKQNHFLQGDWDKEMIVELQINNFNGKDMVKAILKGVSPEMLFIDNELSEANYIKTMNIKPKLQPKYFEYDNLELILEENTHMYGTLFIAGNSASYYKYYPLLKDKIVLNDFMFSSSKNNFTRIILSPVFDENLLLSNYKKIIFLDSPLSLNLVSFINKSTKAEIFIPKCDNRLDFFQCIDLSREIFGKYYDIIRRNSDINAQDIFNYYNILSSRNNEIKLKQFIVCVMVFFELGIITIGNIFSLKIDKNVKNELTNSNIYRMISEII